MRSLWKTVISSLVASFMLAANASAAPAEATVYGSFMRMPSAPNILFLTGEIDKGDLGELKNAIREAPVELLVASSPGGYVDEALEIAELIHLLRIATYVPPEAVCASACAFILLAGNPRAVDGKLGVHQFYYAQDDRVPTGNQYSRVQSTQYMASRIIGLLNSFKTPPSVYEKMFSTVDMYYLDPSERAMLILGEQTERQEILIRAGEMLFHAIRNDLIDPPGSGGPQIAGQREALRPSPPHAPNREPPGDFLRYASTDIPGADLLREGIRGVSIEACEASCAENAMCSGYSYSVKTSWCWPKKSALSTVQRFGVVSGIKQPLPGLSLMQEAAVRLLVRYQATWSQPNDRALYAIPGYYMVPLNHFGQILSEPELIEKLRRAAERWPNRTYELVAGSIDVKCNEDRCNAFSLVDWSTFSRERGKSSSGRSTWRVELVRHGSELYIAAESGEVISRN